MGRSQSTHGAPVMHVNPINSRSGLPYLKWEKVRYDLCFHNFDDRPDIGRLFVFVCPTGFVCFVMIINLSDDK